MSDKKKKFIKAADKEKAKKKFEAAVSGNENKKNKKKVRSTKEAQKAMYGTDGTEEE